MACSRRSPCFDRRHGDCRPRSTGSFSDGAIYDDRGPAVVRGRALHSRAASRRMRSRASGVPPSASRRHFARSTEMVDIELPSRGRTCGAAVTISDCANPDGPASAGAACLSTAHAEAANTASAAAAAAHVTRLKSIRALHGCPLVGWIGEIAESRRRCWPVDAHFVAGLVAAIERHLGNRRDDVAAERRARAALLRLAEWRTILKRARRRAVGRDGERERRIEVVRHVDARRRCVRRARRYCTSIAVDGDLVQQARAARRRRACPDRAARDATARPPGR